MAILSNPSKNFIHALSSFWTTFFVDANDLRSYYDGVQINLGQVYLEMLQTVLGTSLKDMPLFSNHYFKYVEVSRSKLYFVEGASPAEDTYAFTPSDYSLAGVGAFANRVLSSTASLAWKRDYYVSGGAIRFRRDLFDVDGAGTSEPRFPVKTVEEVAPAVFTEPSGADWANLGVRVGDYLRLRVLGGGGPTFSRIEGISGSVLYLGVTQPDYDQSFTSRTLKVSVVRTPYDADRIGVVFPAQPASSVRFASTATDGATTPGTKDVSLLSEAFYKGAWAILTTYDAGDVVDYGGASYRAKAAHTSSTTFDTASWLPLAGTYVYVSSAESALNCGLAKCTSAAAGVLTLDRSLNFEPTITDRVDLVLVTFAGAYASGAKPAVTLPQTFLEAGTVYVIAIRALDVKALAADGTLVTLPAGVNVQEGIDYVVDYETGVVTILTPWATNNVPRVNYAWRREIATLTYNNPTATLFTFSKSHAVRVMALWGTDLQVDEESLFNNFGYLLDFKRPTSEQYRTFLRGVAQLFLLGPAVERFESAMNVMAELPVVRDDNELLLGYDSGVLASGVDGQLIDFDSGRNGVLSAPLSRFTALTADFYPSDVGARLLVRNGELQDAYTVVEVVDSTTVRISPTPPDMAVPSWTYAHVAMTTRFRTPSYAFAPDDVNGTITVSGSNNARNNGTFKILAVENATTVLLETQYGFDDELNLTWSLSRTNQQTVETSRATYVFPLAVAMRPEITDTANHGYLSLRAFECFTTAFQVVDYIRDPTWWHNVVIPDQVLQLQAETPVRRRVSTNFIEHVYNPLDQANFGDFGMAYGVNDEAVLGQQRRGTALWFGSNSVQLAYPPGSALARLRDVGEGLVIRTPGFAGAYPISSVVNPESPGSIEHTTLVLERFPPPEALHAIPPVALDVELPPLLYRRTVAFVMMDRFLKYHAVQVKIDKSTPLPSNFVQDVTRLISEAKPAHTYVYLESLTDFVDHARLLEAFEVGYGPLYVEPLFAVDNVLKYSATDGVRYGDAFQFVDGNTSIAGSAGTTTLPVVLPVGDVEYTLVKVRFDAAARVNGGTRRPVEGEDYTVDYAAGTLTIPVTASVSTSPNNVYYVYCVRRIRSDVDPLDPGETRLAYGSSNPRIYRASTQSAQQMGLVDRAVQITLGP